MIDSHHKNAHARKLFDGIAGSYERPAELLSFLQYGHWRKTLVSGLKLAPTSLALDVCTGTGLVAIEMASRSGCRVVGLDLSEQMVDRARGAVQRSGLDGPVSLTRGRAEDLPFADASFDAVVFTFLLRYVEHPEPTIRELARVLRPGGRMASLEFYVPPRPVLYPLWLLHTHVLLPLAARFISHEWREVGSFLGPSISAFYRDHTLADLQAMWQRAGIGRVQTKVLSLGGAVVMSGQKEAHSAI